jgi:hypothetical protein
VTVTRRRVAERVTAEVEPCACDERGGVCGWHYSQLSHGERVAVRVRLGIDGGGAHKPIPPESRERAETWGETVTQPRRTA